jgi:hypothetical protein
MADDASKTTTSRSNVKVKEDSPASKSKSDEKEKYEPNPATRQDDEFEADYTGEPKTVEQNFTYLENTDPNKLASPSGIYLGDEMRREAEIVRARLEEREPDLENPPAVQGTPLVPTHVAESLAQPGVAVPVDKKLPVVIGQPQDDDTQDADASEDGK